MTFPTYKIFGSVLDQKTLVVGKVILKTGRKLELNILFILYFFPVCRDQAQKQETNQRRPHPTTTLRGKPEVC